MIRPFSFALLALLHAKAVTAQTRTSGSSRTAAARVASSSRSAAAYTRATTSFRAGATAGGTTARDDDDYFASSTRSHSDQVIERTRTTIIDGRTTTIRATATRRVTIGGSSQSTTIDLRSPSGIGLLVGVILAIIVGIAAFFIVRRRKRRAAAAKWSETKKERDEEEEEKAYASMGLPVPRRDGDSESGKEEEEAQGVSPVPVVPYVATKEVERDEKRFEGLTSEQREQLEEEERQQDLAKAATHEGYAVNYAGYAEPMDQPPTSRT